MPIAAFITQHADWHLLFVISTVLGVACLVCVLATVRESSVRQSGNVDIVGGVGMSLGLGMLLIVVSRANQWGWDAPVTMILLVGGCMLLLLWGWFELHMHDPLVDLRVSASRPVLFTNLASFAMGFALFSASVAFPQQLQLPTDAGGLGIDLLTSSLIVMPSGLIMLVMAPITARMQRRLGSKILFVISAVIIAAAYLVAICIPVSVWGILTVNLLIGVGIGIGYAAMPALILQSVPVEQAGAANGINALTRALGTSSASAVIAAMLASSSVIRGGTSVPLPSAFRMAYVAGLLSAVCCAAFALCIRQNTNDR